MTEAQEDLQKRIDELKARLTYAFKIIENNCLPNMSYMEFIENLKEQVKEANETDKV